MIQRGGQLHPGCFILILIFLLLFIFLILILLLPRSSQIPTRCFPVWHPPFFVYSLQPRFGI
jgi:hypothetical protein